MKTSFVFDKKVRKGALIILIVAILITLVSQVIAHSAMTNWYHVKVSNVWITNKMG